MSRLSCRASDEESHSDVVGDELCSHAQLITTRAITIEASPEQIFPWIRQMGFGKAGWYSYDLLDNLGRKSATSIRPEWQNVHSGDAIPGGPVSFTAVVVTVPHSFVLLFHGHKGFSKRICFSLAYELRQTGASTRLVTRVRARIDFPLGGFIAKYLLGPGDGFMLRKQLRSIAERADASFKK